MLVEIYNGTTLMGFIDSAQKWSNTDRLNRAGTFSFTMPSTDPKAVLIQGKRIARGYLVVNGTRTLIGEGIIDERNINVRFENGPELVVGGDNLLRELTNTSVGFLQIDNGSGGGSATALADIMAKAQAGWSLDTVIGYGSAGVNVYASFAGELVLDALVKVAEKLGHYFRLGSSRKVVWMRAVNPDSGVRAVQAVSSEAGDDPSICIIKSLNIVNKSYNIATRIYPFGAGNGDARLTMMASTMSAPVGYTLDKTNNYLEKNSATAQFGLIERYVSFKDIRPISNTTPDLQSAADALYTATKTHLDQNCIEQTIYDLAVVGINDIVYPGEFMHVTYRNYVDGYKAIDVDEDLIILETTTEISDMNVRTVGMKVSNVAQWGKDDANLVSEQIGESRVFESHSQLSASVDTFTYRDEMDNSHGASMRFWLGDEYTSIQRALLRFRIQPLRSTVKSVAGTSTTTSSGGGSTSGSGGGATPTSASGGSSTATSASGGGATSGSDGASNPTSASGGSTTPTSGNQSGSHQHGLTLEAGTVAYPIGIPSGNNKLVVGGGWPGASFSTMGNQNANHTHDVTIPNHTHTVSVPAHTHSTPNHTHNTDIPAHTHDVTIPSHTHSTPDHTHDLTPQITMVYGIFEESGANTLALPDLAVKLNGGSDLRTSVVDIGNGWYELDVTDALTDAIFRPSQENNELAITTSVAKTARIEAQLTVRGVVQAVANL